MGWEVEFTDQFGEWLASLDEIEQDRVAAAILVLRDRGPGLGRPFVDTIKGSRHANMKELRPRGGNLRVLFAFDPRRKAILLMGGDKTNRWDEWFRTFIPYADRLYDGHLERLKKEGLLP